MILAQIAAASSYGPEPVVTAIQIGESVWSWLAPGALVLCGCAAGLFFGPWIIRRCWEVLK